MVATLRLVRGSRQLMRVCPVVRRPPPPNKKDTLRASCSQNTRGWFPFGFPLTPTNEGTLQQKGQTLGVDSPFFSTIVLFYNQLFPRVLNGFLKRRIPGKTGEGSPRRPMWVLGPCQGQEDSEKAEDDPRTLMLMAVA